MLNHKERMKKGLPYQCWLDGLSEERAANKKKIMEFNHMESTDIKEIQEKLKMILGVTGENVYIEAPFRCDYGKNISVGENFFANYNLCILDVNDVKIGANVQMGPNVSIITAGHPIHYEARNSQYEFGLPITIGNNAWIGANVTILPNVTIGDHTVIGAGSIVTSNIPENVVAVGNPCKVIRSITDEDKNYYYKNKRFDVEDYLVFRGGFYTQGSNGGEKEV